LETWGPFSVSGRRVIVTGGAMGIGLGIVRRFVEGGASVLLVDRDEGAAYEAARKIGAPAERLQTMAVDVGEEAAAPAIVQRAVRAFGGLDVLVNNAGIYPQIPAMQMTPALFDQVIRINLRAPVMLCKAAAARMIEQAKPGRIINICSIDSVHPSMVGLAAYDASKGALYSFTKSLALELAPKHILVNAIAPGGIATEGTAKPLQASGMDAQQMKEAMAHFIKAKVPLGRMGMPDEIATATVFLASQASSYMTGALLLVDGGTLLT
jgi:2-dehydro-3-deoxy-D-gluconate 5-dehydrogenase